MFSLVMTRARLTTAALHCRPCMRQSPGALGQIPVHLLVIHQPGSLLIGQTVTILSSNWLQAAVSVSRLGHNAAD